MPKQEGQLTRGLEEWQACLRNDTYALIVHVKEIHHGIFASTCHECMELKQSIDNVRDIIVHIQ